MDTRIAWDEMKYWTSPEWETVQKRLDELDQKRIHYNPSREKLFAALDATPWHLVKVAIFGQDPYPDPTYATGVAFSIPEKVEDFPPTLENIFKELEADLRYPRPKTGDLKKWTEQGVLLWNVIPSCTEWRSLSHNWDEWIPLTKEIVESLDDTEGVVFVFLGAHARKYAPLVLRCPVIEAAHPVARANNDENFKKRCPSFKPFNGSRLFSSINAKLREVSQSPIDWRL